MAQGTFNYLSQSAVQSDKGKVYGNLLNVMLVRSWPSEQNGGEVDDKNLLHHLLTWQTCPGFLEYFGM